jgi:DNA-binding transcriptional MerR regulator
MENVVGEFPEKDSYKLSEVCQYTDTQPYVLRFWESEFPQLSGQASGGGARTYSKEDIDLVQRIKHLLYEEEYTLAGARKKLEDEKKSAARGRGKTKSSRKSGSRATAKPKGASASRKSRTEETAPAPEPFETRAPEPQLAPRLPLESREEPMVPRQRYEDAVDEIEHLRLKLKEAENGLRKTDTTLDELREEADRERRRAEKAIERMERLVEMLR